MAGKSSVGLQQSEVQDLESPSDAHPGNNLWSTPDDFYEGGENASPRVEKETYDPKKEVENAKKRAKQLAKFWRTPKYQDFEDVEPWVNLDNAQDSDGQWGFRKLEKLKVPEQDVLDSDEIKRLYEFIENSTPLNNASCW